jgi:hypothetical protein
VAPSAARVQHRQADNHRGRDQGVADGAKPFLAGAAEQLGAEPDADAIDRTDQKRKSNGVGSDQPGQRIADERKEIRGAEKQQDVGARDHRGKRPAKPITDDRRPAGLCQPAAKAGQSADADGKRGVVFAPIAPARQQQREQREHEAGDDPARRHWLEPAEEPGSDGHADQCARYHDGGCLAVRVLPGIGKERRGGDEIDDEQEGCNQARRRKTARQRHENQRRAETGKSARRSRHESDRADGDGDAGADIRRDEAEPGHHPRSTPPVFFATSATILAPTASIS